MKISMRQYSHGFVFILGLVLIIGGLITRTEGAWIIGLIVAAVNFQQWQKWNQEQSPMDNKK
jgi:hypothetical protein